MTDNRLLLAALDYAQKGYAVFPIVPRDKKPLTKNGLDLIPYHYHNFNVVL